MKLLFCALGKGHESYIREGVDDFTKRITNYYPVKWQLITSPKNASGNELKRKEAELVLAALSKNDYLVVLDERGSQLTSEGLSKFLESRTNESRKQVVFLIGGAFGIDDKVLERANFRWSLSNLTFPHQLVRLILSEQVYRACTISKNEKYHHI